MALLLASPSRRIRTLVFMLVGLTTLAIVGLLHNHLVFVGGKWLLPTLQHASMPFMADHYAVDLIRTQEFITPEELRQYADNIERLLPQYQQAWPAEPSWKARSKTIERLQSLRDCLWRTSCSPQQMTVVIGGSLHFGNSIRGSVSGEDIWARSSIDAFETSGYTLLFTWKGLEALDVYQMIPKLVRIVILDGIDIKNCAHFGRPQMVLQSAIKQDHFRPMEEVEWKAWKLSTPPSGKVWAEGLMEGKEDHNGCIRSVEFPEGIPLWKIFAWHFWSSSEHPLGHNWTLAPEDWSKHPSQHKARTSHNQYLGYSVEQWCSKFRHPIRNRIRARQAFILAKLPDYFAKSQFPWGGRDNNTLFADIGRAWDIAFFAGAGQPGERIVKEGVENLGRMSFEKFNAQLTDSRALIGIGEPTVSPTPYDALCLGTPFIHPIRAWNREAPDDKQQWAGQHDGLLELDEPYVYHVRANDIIGFESALKKAIERPIDPYIPPHLTPAAVRRRHQFLVLRDWRAEFFELMPKLDNSGPGSLKGLY